MQGTPLQKVINSRDYAGMAVLFEKLVASTLQNVITRYPYGLAENQGTTTAL